MSAIEPLFSVSQLSQAELNEAKALRDKGYVPDPSTTIKLTHAIAKSMIKGFATADPGALPAQELISHKPHANFSRSSTITERLVMYLVACGTAEVLKQPCNYPQLCPDVALEDKWRILDTSTPCDDDLEHSVFVYLNGHDDEFAQMPTHEELAEYINLPAIVNTICDALSMGYDAPHIPTNTLCVPMTRDDTGVISPITAQDARDAVTASPKPSFVARESTVDVPVVFVRAMRIPKDLGVKFIESDNYEPWFFAIIGDVIFAPFDSDMCNIAFVHMLTRRYALLHGVKYVRVVITLDLRTMTVVPLAYF